MNRKKIRSPQSSTEWLAYYDLRYRILRKPWNQPPSSAKTPEDEDALHFALYEKNKLCAIARLDLQQDNKAQIRFVATDTNCQGKGYGKELMHAIEDYCKSVKIQEIILEARENAVLFYLALGYEQLNEGKLLFGEINHWWMRKELKNHT